MKKEYNCVCLNCDKEFIAYAPHAKYCTTCKNEEHRYTCSCGCGTVKVYTGLKKYFEGDYLVGHKQRLSSEREKKSLYAKENNFGKWMLGKSLSKETKENIRIKKTGLTRSEEYRKNISLSKMGEKNGMFGRKHTEEIKAEIGAASRNNWEKPEYRSNMQEYYSSEKGQQDYRSKAFKTQEILKGNKFKNTKPELQMKEILESLQIEYIHNYPMKDIKHIYYADFFIPSLNLIIEVDGKYWHKYPFGRELDRLRNKELIEEGYNILRYWEGDFTVDSVKDNFLELENKTKDSNHLLEIHYLNNENV